jgi:AMMECR1 domain-containing protein
LTKEELPQLKIKVDLLSIPRLSKEETLDPRIYGVIVKTEDGRCGLLLPDLPGVESYQKQLSICRQKAGISPDEEIKIFCFTVERHEE